MRRLRKKQSIVYLITGILLLTMMVPCRAFANSMPAFETDEGVYLIDPDTGDAYVKQNEDTRYYPASTTKILTALTAMDEIADILDERVTIGAEISMIDADSSVAKLTEGDSYTWRELLYGMLLPSGNDAAMTIAVNAAKLHSNKTTMSETEAISVFSEMMNDKAEEIGAEDSHFVNPHGLVNEQHYTTPADMTKITIKAFENEEIAEICRTKLYSCVSGNGTTQEWQNTNILIQNSSEKFSDETKTKLGITDNSNPYFSSYASSGKTGYDEAAGRCLVFTGDKGEMKMVGVIFKASDMQPIYSQAKAALESAVTEFSHVALANPYTEVTTLHASLFSGFHLSLSLEGQDTLTVSSDEKDQLNAVVEWDEQYCQNKGYYIKILSDFEAGTQVATLHIYGKTYENWIPLTADKGMKVIGILDYILIGLAAVLIIGLIFYLVIQIKYHRINRREKKMRRKKKKMQHRR